MKIALFLTTDRERARQLAGSVQQQHPGAEIAAFVNDDDRAALADTLANCDVRRDKPVGGKGKFVRDLRTESFDLVVVAWHGGERFQPLRLVALMAGAGRVIAVDERGRERRVAWYLPWTWLGHVFLRAAQLDMLAVLRLAAAVYRATLGALFACAALSVFSLFRPRIRGR